MPPASGSATLTPAPGITESVSAKNAADIPIAAVGRMARRKTPIVIPRKNTSINAATPKAPAKVVNESNANPPAGLRKVKNPAGTSAMPIGSRNPAISRKPAQTCQRPRG